MESKFTPGPWWAGGKAPNRVNECWILSEANPREVIARVRPEMISSTISVEEADANAYLIAAAPDMFEALNKCLEYFLAHNNTSSETPMAAAAAVKKALNITNGK